jgi:hypothetical protein
VAGHGIGDALIGRGREYHRHPPSLGRLEVLDQVAPVRKGCHIGCGLARQMMLETGFALRKPERHQQEAQRPALRQDEQGLDQQIRRDQGAVQVDHQWQRAASVNRPDREPGRLRTLDHRRRASHR